MVPAKAAHHLSTKRRARVAALGFLPLVLWLIWLGFEEIDYRKGVDPATMIVASAQLPTVLSLSDESEMAIDWKTSGTSMIRAIDHDWESSWQAGYAWTNGGKPDGAPFLSHSFHRYATALTAGLRFFQLRPATEYRLHGRDVTLAPRLIDLPSASLSASQQHVLCLQDAQQQCMAWEAWFRYGRYISHLHIVHTEPTSAVDITAIAAAIDAHIAARFTDSTPEYPDIAPVFLRPAVFSMLLWAPLSLIALVVSHIRGESRIYLARNAGGYVPWRLKIDGSNEIGVFLAVFLAAMAGLWALLAHAIPVYAVIEWLVFLIVIALAIYAWAIAFIHG